MLKYKNNKLLENKYDIENYIGKIFTSKNYGDFKIIGIYNIQNNTKRYICEFIKDGFQTIAYRSNILKGTVKNNYTPYIFNVGYLGDIGINEYIYNNEYWWIWHDMLKRCYDKNHHKKYKTYTDCVVAERWLNFSNFNNDVSLILGYKEMKIYSHIKFEIDKDILLHKNKKYSLETCCFVPKDINIFFCNIKESNKSGYEGVTYHKVSEKYQASIGFLGNREYLGIYTNPEIAYEVYHKAKYNSLKSLVENQYSFLDDKIKNAMFIKLENQYKDTKELEDGTKNK